MAKIIYNFILRDLETRMEEIAKRKKQTVKYSVIWACVKNKFLEAEKLRDRELSLCQMTMPW